MNNLRAITDPQQIIDICEEYRRGKTSTDLGRKYFCSGSTILDILHEQGVQVRDSQFCNHQDVAMMMQDWNTGINSHTIARQYGYKNIISMQGAVIRWRKKGWDFKPRPTGGKRAKGEKVLTDHIPKFTGGFQ